MYSEAMGRDPGGRVSEKAKGPPLFVSDLFSLDIPVLSHSACRFPLRFLLSPSPFPVAFPFVP
jgi:hypothetical protein